MIAEVMPSKIQKVSFSINEYKSPGPDGFTALFFQKAWHIIQQDFVSAIQSFFKTGKLLAEVNATIISLIPKVKKPSIMGEFRPISCCNIICSCITKFPANRVKPCLNDVASGSHTPFISNRSLSENVLLAQEIVKNYHREKSDLMKAYDTVRWEFILHCLKGNGVPDRFVDWVKVCITTPNFSAAFNGSLAGSFGGCKGFKTRQFIITFFSFCFSLGSLLQPDAAISLGTRFKFHPRCADLKLTHLCFADD